MDKIKVSKEVAAALDLGIKVAGKERLLDDHFSCMTWKLKEYEPLNQISNWKMAQILINGYEVKDTPEEVLLKEFLNELETPEKYTNTFNDGIQFALETLGIKIKGIND